MAKVNQGSIICRKPFPALEAVSIACAALMSWRWKNQRPTALSENGIWRQYARDVKWPMRNRNNVKLEARRREYEHNRVIRRANRARHHGNKLCVAKKRR